MPSPRTASRNSNNVIRQTDQGGTSPQTPVTTPLPSIASDTVVQLESWPVPQVIIGFREHKIAYGRRAIMKLGRDDFLRFLYVRFVWVPVTVFGRVNRNQKLTDYAWEDSDFRTGASLMGTFYHTHGQDDVGKIKLGDLGWYEMINNIVRIDVEYSGNAVSQ
ncbi:hypothetical protein PHLGIDRAFT_373736 [Phlebiopsis gigantea 11061_1 CR5-6]|uniref:Uncharacterized protein n=1 Tax=Phlebiopsis gigantea (strain 11061_1 CR5-6) TaxID=745531 RepID=A0A0C3S0V4_PHLG1|nr:hypothetical protein PHLGIDRAFT_373736 [Phlebiopsis gigantea 11061_1 CR5-6]